jgi:hypothetical protein
MSRGNFLLSENGFFGAVLMGYRATQKNFLSMNYFTIWRLQMQAMDCIKGCSLGVLWLS